MKKDGSSNSRSKTPRISKSTAHKAKSKQSQSSEETQTAHLAQSIAVGHSPAERLSPKDEALFRAFQSNLLSLISHELRTPLTGILNALMVLEEMDIRPSGENALSVSELIKMANRNAQRLQHALASLLDLASLESGTFHVRLREVDFSRVIQTHVRAQEKLLKNNQIRLIWDQGESSSTANQDQLGSPILADPQKLGQVIDLCFQILLPRVQPQSEVQLKYTFHEMELSFQLTPQSQKNWEAAWAQSWVGFQGRIASPGSAFAGVLQPEKAFLNRTEEGLGSEFLLVHELMKLHHGKFLSQFEGGKVSLRVELPELSSEEGLHAVLVSRVYQSTTQLGTVALVLMEVPEASTASAFCKQVKKNLFRSTDSVYPVLKTRQVAVVLDDCKFEDVPQLMFRLSRSLEFKPAYGVAHCPTDGLDARLLIELAGSRLKTAIEKRSN